MTYDQNTTLVFGFKYTFSDPESIDSRVYVGTYIDHDHGSYWDEDDNKFRFYEDIIIKVDDVETRIPCYYTGVRVWD